MENRVKSISPTFTPKQIEVIKIGIALKYSTNQGGCEIITHENTSTLSPQSFPSKPNHKKSEDVSQNNTGNG